MKYFYTSITKRALPRARNIVLLIKDIEKEQCIFKFCTRVQVQMFQDHDREQQPFKAF